MGLGQVLGAEPQIKTAPPAVSPAERPVSAKPVNRSKKGNNRQARSYTPEAVAEQALQSLFGN